ncbi:hypothetical protein CHLRE_05g240050v5 [Chlamydomonas reinhardtii]|uniref:Wax synthase domain-containing protein n=1 Tax=Chlamydomonas reinhardtii TaxID=3055 RepID=A0A2K3DT56_CHLRE|nr:uncharacterized protein CHLRE_05g240050v5 [Chlamydomonas reinhardtii]PNW83708.1 hypothetical protein CHLRE_05g240050v5 [Chlamydomonas reinhardtii]
MYVKIIHGQPSAALRLALTTLSTGAYFAAVLRLHPWQPYWIRELSVMLAQLYAWKATDLALLRHGEPLRRFWPFLLFDVLVLRPPALVLPGSSSSSADSGSGSSSSSAGSSDSCSSSRNGAGETGATADGTGAARGGEKERCQPGVRRRRHGQPNVPLGSSVRALEFAAGATATAVDPATVAPAAIAGSPQAVALGAAKAKLGGGEQSHAHSSGRRRAGDDPFQKLPAGAVGSQAATAAAASAAAATSEAAAAATRAPAAGAAAAAGAAGAAAAPRQGAALRGPSRQPGAAAAAVGVLPRLRLAARVVAGPLLDFARAYCCCEAANAYLMHRRPEDVLGAQYLTQVLLSCCFATALYCHLSYFFHSMEMLWLAGFALAGGHELPRWAPLFNAPYCSSSPVDFWNNRWHQAFRWWWTRLVFTPVRRALTHGLDRLQQRYGTDGMGAGARTAADDGGNGGDGGGCSPWKGRQEERRQKEVGQEEGQEEERKQQGEGRALKAAPHHLRRGGGGGVSVHVTAAAHAAAHVHVFPSPASGSHAHVHGAHKAEIHTAQQNSSHASKRKTGNRSSGSSSSSKHAGANKASGSSSSSRRGSSGSSNITKSSRSGGSGCSSRGLLLGARLARWLLARRRGLQVSVPTVAVFAFSALFHESLLWINFGRPTGEQAAFFLLHAAILLLQRAGQAAAPRLAAALRSRLPRPLRCAACLTLLASTSPLFFAPWFRNSYHRELRVLFYGPTQWAVRVWALGRAPEAVRLFW